MSALEGGLSMASDVSVSAVVEFPVAELRCWPENPRRITPGRLDDLKRALMADPAMLRARPLLVLPDGEVFGGNQRLRAVVELGWETVPVVVVDLGRDQARLWALRDNNAYGEWDEPALAELLAELAAGGVDLALTGFAARDLDQILDSIAAPADPDEVPPLPDGAAGSKAGEVYPLGRHRLLCGDATDREQILELVVGESVELLWADPPYGVSYVGKTKRALRLANDDAGGLPDLLRRSLAAVDAVLAPGGRFYVASPAGPLGTEFRLALRDVGWQLHQTLVWVKQVAVLGHGDYHYQHEDILYGWKPGPGRVGRGRHRGSRWQGDNAQTSVFFVDRPSRSSEHPTMKPVELIARQLRNSSRHGDLVLDPFAGSGSTLIACEQLGRRCLAVEIDPRYCDVIRRRYEEFCGGR
jgi:DNA modification methylase